MKIQSRNPVDAAREVHFLLGWTQPSDFTVDEIAGAMGILVRNIPIEGSEGRILIKGDSAVVSVSDGIVQQGRRNFVLGHEIGHFVLHKDVSALFLDTDLTLSEWFKKGIQEQQANTFASELLMPETLYRQKVAGMKLNIHLIEDVSAYFHTSLLAAFIRYVSLGSFPVMIVFMEDNIIKWKFHSHDFPFTYLPLNYKVPPWTVAGDYFNNGTLEAQPEKVNAIEWFPEDFQIKYKANWKLWEQCYQVGQKALVSCLWTF